MRACQARCQDVTLACRRKLGTQAHARKGGSLTFNQRDIQPACPASVCPPPPALFRRDAKEAAEKAAAEAAAAEAKRATRKQGKNFALMSFGEGGSVAAGCCA